MFLLIVTNSSVLLLNNYVYLINPVRIRFRRPANPKSASNESEQT